jgi:hypothetical protein
LGPTQGYRRHHRDFYQEDGRPKELWMRALHPKARRWLGGKELPLRLRRHEDPAMHCPYTVKQFRSLWERMNGLPDKRRSKGRRHRIGSTLTICALGTLCGARGTRAIAEFASYLNQTQLRLLRAYRNPKTGRYESPSEPTIRRMLKSAQILSTLRSLARFLAKQGAHHPRNAHQATTPALNRYCTAHRTRTIRWLV